MHETDEHRYSSFMVSSHGRLSRVLDPTFEKCISKRPPSHAKVTRVVMEADGSMDLSHESSEPSDPRNGTEKESRDHTRQREPQLFILALS